MSEEAEERRHLHFLLTHLCGISHRPWRTFHTIRTATASLSQYSQRPLCEVPSVTGSGGSPPPSNMLPPLRMRCVKNWAPMRGIQG
ncbi:hypothetical protein GDQ70_24190 [Escherichia coli]|nr:hypothetical protein [Escherichia coli]EFD0589543.1 hypothetical protein [Escherichia coli]EFE6877406.1 hypothetical protein [Escherichia coli]EFE7005611.1 hypothetical protein [Escherichia coli]KAA9902115.1 hypothetical protein F7F54_03395 [Escherichia coli]